MAASGKACRVRWRQRERRRAVAAHSPHFCPSWRQKFSKVHWVYLLWKVTMYWILIKISDENPDTVSYSSAIVQVCVCVCVCVCVYIYIYIYSCMVLWVMGYQNKDVHAYMHTYNSAYLMPALILLPGHGSGLQHNHHMHVCICICMCICICICVCMCICICMHVRSSCESWYEVLQYNHYLHKSMNVYIFSGIVQLYHLCINDSIFL